jgi:hypothetical protein
MPDYGYLYLGRVLNQDSDSGGYHLESVGLARTSRWGPVPSCVPGLLRGDRVIMGAKGTSRDDLVILGRVGQTFPGVGDIDGLLDALADKARAVELDSLERQVNALSATVDTTTASQDARDDAQDASITANTAAISANTTLLGDINPYSRGNDREIYQDTVSSIPRWAGQTTVPLDNGMALYTRLVCRRDLPIRVLKMSYAKDLVPTAGTMNWKIYAGTNLAALPLLGPGYSGTLPLGGYPGRADFFLAPADQRTVPAGTSIVVGLCPTGLAAGETAKVVCSNASPTDQLLNEGNTVMTSAMSAAGSSLPTTLKFDNRADWATPGSAVAWIALQS